MTTATATKPRKAKPTDEQRPNPFGFYPSWPLDRP